MKTSVSACLRTASGCILTFALSCSFGAVCAMAQATVTVSGTQWGVSTAYIGANEGSDNFNINDLTDLGINSYRIYGGMARWEWQDDSPVFGQPTIAQIKANPGVINWAWWDAAFNCTTAQQAGSDYWWDQPGYAGLWKGSAVTIFSSLQTAHIRPVVVLRNQMNQSKKFGGTQPPWASALNPPNTANGQNEWWEHVFATVYWLNVRNNYQVDDWEVHNEPDQGCNGSGWCGTEADYLGVGSLGFNFIQLTNDAIQYVYSTYLPGRTPHVYAPVTTGGSSWPLDALNQSGLAFNTVDIHNYNNPINSYTEQVHGYLNTTGYATRPIWLTEWGTWHSNKYNNVSFAVSNVIANIINGSMPGNDYIYGSHLWSLYDWDTFASGIISVASGRGYSYYGMRMAIRGLQGARPTYQSTSTASNIQAITTKDTAGHYWVLLNNPGSTTTTTVNLSALLTSGTGTMWQFDSTHLDVIVGNPVLSGGQVTVTVPGTGAVLLEF